jgi:SPP1 family predicted phage head-tail adaptor
MQYRKPKLNIGQMRHRVTLQYPAKVPDGQGGTTDTWTDTATVWAGIFPMSGNEVIRAKQAQTQITLKVRIWYRTDVTPAWRVVFGNRVFDIDTIINREEKNVVLELLCSEKK